MRWGSRARIWGGDFPNKDRESGEPAVTWRLDGYQGGQGQIRGGEAVEHEGRPEI